MSITTKAALLRAAETQMRSKGYSAFSYADLAAQIGIKKASIRHHFPTKESLGACATGRWTNPLRPTRSCC